MNRTDEVEFIAPLRVDVAVDDRLVTIGPLVVSQLPQLLEVCAPLFRQLALFDDGAIARFRDGKPTESDLATLLSVLSADAEDIFKVFSICSGMPVEWVAGLLPDRFARIAAICIEVNRDFFSRALPPAVLQALAGSVARSATAQPSPSS